MASQVPRFGQLLTLLCIILRMDIASWVPRLGQLLTAKLCSHPRTQASQVWRFERLLTKHKYGLSHSYASQTPHFEQILISQGSQSHGRTCFAGIVFRAIALQARELADTPNGFEGSSIAAIHSFALVDCRLSRNPIRLSWQLLRDHFGFVGHPLPRPQVEWIGVSIKIVSPLGTKLALF